MRGSLRIIIMDMCIYTCYTQGAKITYMHGLDICNQPSFILGLKSIASTTIVTNRANEQLEPSGFLVYACIVLRVCAMSVNGMLHTCVP